MSEPHDPEFDDYEDDGPDDSATIAAYADELTAAVDALGLTVLEPGEVRP